MMSYNGLSTNEKGVETKMKTTINLYNKRNEVVFQYVFHAWSCLLLNDNCYYMWCHGWWMDVISMIA
jgi:hypothetical protein